MLANALSFLVSAVCLLRIRTTEPEPALVSALEEKASLWRDVAEGVKFVVHDPYIRLIALSVGRATSANAR